MTGETSAPKPETYEGEGAGDDRKRPNSTTPGRMEKRLRVRACNKADGRPKPERGEDAGKPKSQASNSKENTTIAAMSAQTPRKRCHSNKDEGAAKLGGRNESRAARKQDRGTPLPQGGCGGKGKSRTGQSQRRRGGEREK